MIKIYESVNESVPDWIRNSSTYKSFLIAANKRGIDLYNAKFVEIDPPTSNRDPILKDDNKILIMLIYTGYKHDGYELYSPSEVFSEWLNPYVSSLSAGGGKYADQMSWKAILSRTAHCGYYDISNAKKDPELLNARRLAKQGDINYNRDQHKQYKYRDSDAWLTHSARGGREYDKSGYLIPTPTELLGRLYDPTKSSWDQVLNNIYIKIKKIDQSVKSKVSQIDEFSKEAADIQRDYYGRLSTVLYYYEELADSIAYYDEQVAKDDGSDKSKLNIKRAEHYCSNNKSTLLTNITYLKDEAKRLDQLI